ncbi:hypothetical protein GCM10010278_83290 [Streptomyces melanogenes]|nr:hypothetical protein GCM10010278_83290 [Streptomyces melanogenes]
MLRGEPAFEDLADFADLVAFLATREGALGEAAPWLCGAALGWWLPGAALGRPWGEALVWLCGDAEACEGEDEASGPWSPRVSANAGDAVAARRTALAATARRCVFFMRSDMACFSLRG